MWKVFPFRELSNQEPSGPRRQTLPILDLVIKALSVTAGVEQAPLGSGAPPPTSTMHHELMRAESWEVRAPKTALESSSFCEQGLTNRKEAQQPAAVPLLLTDWFSSFYKDMFIDSQLLLQLIWLCGFQPPFIISNSLETSSHKSLIFEVSILFLFNV